jgi:hypothetical protein
MPGFYRTFFELASVHPAHARSEADIGVHFLFAGLDGEEVVGVADVVVVFPLLDLFEFLILARLGEDFAVGLPDRGLPVGWVASDGGVFAEGIHDDGLLYGVDSKNTFQDLGNTGEPRGEVEVNDVAVRPLLRAGRVIGVCNEDLGVMACGGQDVEDLRVDQISLKHGDRWVVCKIGEGFDKEAVANPKAKLFHLNPGRQLVCRKALS